MDSNALGLSRKLAKAEWKANRIGHASVAANTLEGEVGKPGSAWAMEVLARLCEQEPDEDLRCPPVVPELRAELRLVGFGKLVPDVSHVVDALRAHLAKGVAECPAFAPLPSLPPKLPSFLTLFHPTNTPNTLALPHHLFVSSFDRLAAKLGEPIAKPAAVAIAVLPDAWRLEWAAVEAEMVALAAKANAVWEEEGDGIWGTVIAYGSVAEDTDIGEVTEHCTSSVNDFVDQAVAAFADQVDDLNNQPKKKREYTGNKRAMKEKEAQERKAAHDALIETHSNHLRNASSGWLSTLQQCQSECTTLVQDTTAAANDTLHHVRAVLGDMKQRGDDVQEVDQRLQDHQTWMAGLVRECEAAWAAVVDGSNALVAKAEEEMQRVVKKWQSMPSPTEQVELLTDRDWSKKLKKAEKRWDVEGVERACDAVAAMCHAVRSRTFELMVALAQHQEKALFERLSREAGAALDAATRRAQKAAADHAAALQHGADLLEYALLSILQQSLKQAVEARVKEQAEKLREEEAAERLEKERQEREKQREKEQKEKEQKDKEQREKEKREKEQRDKERREKEKREKAQREKEKQQKEKEHEQVAREQKEKGREKESEKGKERRADHGQESGSEAHAHALPDPAAPPFVPEQAVDAIMRAHAGAAGLVGMCTELEAALRAATAQCADHARHVSSLREENASLRAQLAEAVAQVAALKARLGDKQ